MLHPPARQCAGCLACKNGLDYTAGLTDHPITSLSGEKNPVDRSSLRTALVAPGLLSIVLALASCGGASNAIGSIDPTIIILTPTDTAPAEPTVLPTRTVRATRTPASSPSPTPYATETPSCLADADFDGDVTIMDGTVVGAGAPFTKIWRLRNSGTCGWDSGYSLIYSYGATLGAARRLGLPETAPGQAVDLAVEMRAPVQNGEYVSGWRLVAPNDEVFGPAIYVSIRVDDGTPAPTPVPPTATRTVAPTAGPAPAATATPTAAVGYANISGVTSRSYEIFQWGKQLGNRPNIFSKVGDSITVEWPFLGQIGEGYYHLADHGYLEPVMRYFMTDVARTRNSFAETSLAAMGGWPSWALLEGWRSDPICGGVIPLTCEYSKVRPAVALIMLGTNDVTLQSGVPQFESSMQQIVQKSIDAGVIPVLYTLPWCLCGDVGPFNEAIVRTARTYDVPLVDYHAAMEAGINHGIRDDGIHPSVPPDGFASNFDAEHLKYGYNIRNLVTLQVLDLLWRQVLSR